MVVSYDVQHGSLSYWSKHYRAQVRDFVSALRLLTLGLMAKHTQPPGTQAYFAKGLPFTAFYTVSSQPVGSGCTRGLMNGLVVSA